MYHYNLTLSLAKPSSELSLVDKKDVIDSAIDEYNAKPMQNPKKITVLELTAEHLLIRLQSALPLSSAGKALRTFSQILLSDPDFRKQVTPNGQLFSISSSPTPAEQIPLQDMMDVNSITDVELIHSLIEYVVNKKSSDSNVYKKQRKAIQDMKRIAVASGIIQVR